MPVFWFELTFATQPMSSSPQDEQYLTSSPVQADCDGVPCPFSPAKYSPVRLPITIEYQLVQNSPFTLDELKAGGVISGFWFLNVSSGDSNRWDNGFNAVTNYRWTHATEMLRTSALMTVEYETVSIPEPGAGVRLGAGLAMMWITSYWRKSDRTALSR